MEIKSKRSLTNGESIVYPSAFRRDVCNLESEAKIYKVLEDQAAYFPQK